MTPEQKAYKEYGKALERMNASKKELIKIWRSNENVKGRIGTALIVGPCRKCAHYPEPVKWKPRKKNEN